MASSDGFYLTLPSDGSMATFPNNTVAQFKTLFTQTIDLTDGEWEVGLSEMMYGTSVKNIFQVEAFFDMLITQEFSSQGLQVFPNQSFSHGKNLQYAPVGMFNFSRLV